MKHEIHMSTQFIFSFQYLPVVGVFRTRLIYAEILEANIEFGCGKCWEKSNIDTFAILQIEYLTVPSLLC